MNLTECPICGRPLVSPTGNMKSPVVLLGEFPGVDELNSGYSFVGKTGKILIGEMARLGLGSNAFYLTNLWLHEVTDDACRDAHLSMFLEDCRERKAILAMGSTVSEILTPDIKLSEYYGLEVRSSILPKNIELLYIAPNPAICMYGTIGEFRLSLQKFVNKLREKKII